MISSQNSLRKLKEEKVKLEERLEKNTDYNKTDEVYNLIEDNNKKFLQTENEYRLRKKKFNSICIELDVFCIQQATLIINDLQNTIKKLEKENIMIYSTDYQSVEELLKIKIIQTQLNNAKDELQKEEKLIKEIQQGERYRQEIDRVTGDFVSITNKIELSQEL